MSRPIASRAEQVGRRPAGCQKGGFRNTALLVRSGRVGREHVGDAAISSTATTTASPATAPLFG